jgi:hypothetical protein
LLSFVQARIGGRLTPGVVYTVLALFAAEPAVALEVGGRHPRDLLPAFVNRKFVKPGLGFP